MVKVMFLRTRSKLTGLLAMALIGLTGHGAPAYAVEQRCLDLGSNCDCAEALNTNVYVCENNQGGGPGSCSSGGTAFYHNPADSTSKECAGEIGGGFALWAGNYYPSSFTPVAQTGMPPGNSVTWVLRQTGNNARIVSNNPDTSIKRVCSRFYQRFSPDYQGTGEGACTNNKNIENPAYTAAYNYLTQGGGTPGFSISYSGWSTGGGNITSSLDYMDHHNCMSQWCRFEECVSSGSGNIHDGTDITVEADIVGLNDGKHAHYGPRNIGNASGSYNFSWPYAGYRAGTCAGTREVSHVLDARWTSNTGIWIGPAVEVEGGATAGGTSSAPVPQPQPPQAPTLLQ
jgi:hypothetical protein